MSEDPQAALKWMLIPAEGKTDERYHRAKTESKWVSIRVSRLKRPVEGYADTLEVASIGGRPFLTLVECKPYYYVDRSGVPWRYCGNQGVTTIPIERVEEIFEHRDVPEWTTRTGDDISTLQREEAEAIRERRAREAETRALVNKAIRRTRTWRSLFGGTA